MSDVDKYRKLHNLSGARQAPRSPGNIDSWDVNSTVAKRLAELKKEFRVKAPGVITGKPVGLGGSLGRTEATGFGVVFTVREALRELGIDPRETRASVQGFGNVGQYAIRLLSQIGGRTVCVSCWDQKDRTSYAYARSGGIDLDELLGITDRLGGIDREKAKKLGYEVLPGDAWLEQESEILIPAALENQITGENVQKIHKKVRLIAEGANGPTTPEADKVIPRPSRGITAWTTSTGSAPRSISGLSIG